MKKQEMNPKMEKELESLPKELQPIFIRLVSEYQFHCVERYGRPFVSYAVLSDLIKDGWRPTHEPFFDYKGGAMMSQFGFK